MSRMTIGSDFMRNVDGVVLLIETGFKGDKIPSEGMAMEQKRKAEILELAREMARPGRFKDIVSMEAALITHGYVDSLDLMGDSTLRSELNVLLKRAKAPHQSD